MGNDKGSVLIETVILSLIMVPLFSFFLFSFIWLSIDSYIDHQLDEHLLCRLENKSNCLNSTLKNLKAAHIKIHSLTEKSQLISIKGQYLQLITFNKKRRLQYDLKI